MVRTSSEPPLRRCVLLGALRQELHAEDVRVAVLGTLPRERRLAVLLLQLLLRLVGLELLALERPLSLLRLHDTTRERERDQQRVSAICLGPAGVPLPCAGTDIRCATSSRSRSRTVWGEQ